MAAPTNPSRFGSYRLTSRIATGGMAEVYLGRHVGSDGTLGPRVAVKRLLPHLASDSLVVRMFLNEARITAQIHHPNVVRILDLGHENGEPFTVMELLEGRSFAEVRQRAAESGKRVPLGIALKILVDACKGLDAAHRAVDEQGRFLAIVHRDFTPDNIHVGVSGDVKVIDFGIAKAQNLGVGTEPGMLKGKFFYMSPEMIAGHPVDHRADLFAAGVMLYEQLCGRRPFTGNDTDEVMDRIAEGKPRKPSVFDPSVPPALEEVCLTALDREPARRFPTLLELNAAIEAVGGSARLANKEAVGAYVNELFPAEKDPHRQTLWRARLADPSLPNAKSVYDFRIGDHLADEPSAPPELEHPAQPASSSELVSPPKPESPAATLDAPVEMVRPVKSRRKLWLALAAGGAVAIVAAAGIVGFSRVFPQKSAEERLVAAATLKDPEQRAAMLLPLLDDERATADHLSAAGDQLLGQAAYAPALRLSEAFARRFPEDARARLIEAQSAMRLRMGKRAEAAAQKAMQLAPRDPAPDLLVAELRELQGDRAGALEALTHASQKAPASQLLGAKRGYLLSQGGQLDEAATVLSAVLDKAFDAPSAAELAFVRLRQGDFSLALGLLKRALKAEPELAKGHYYLGAVLYQQGDMRGAIKAYREADRIDPNDSRALVALCEVQAREKMPDVEQTKKQIAERFPKQASLLVAQCVSRGG